MAHDVFISYASKDKIIADAVCARLEAHGIRCWVAPRDLHPGRPYGEEIIDAIHGCKVMVLVFSSNANTSPHIPKEIERAVSQEIPIIPLRVEDVAPAKSLDYFISSVHWLDALTPPLERHLEGLANTIQVLLRERRGSEDRADTPPRTPVGSPPPIQPTTRPRAGISRGLVFGIAAAALGAIGIFAVVVVTIMMPSALRSKQAANESAAIASLKSIMTAEITYLSSKDGNFGDLPALVSSNLLDSSFLDEKSGYRYRIEASGGDFTATATPVSSNSGRYGYYTTPDGVIRYSTEGRLAPSEQTGVPVQ